MKLKYIVCCFALGLVIVLGISVVDAQAPQRTAKEGIYTEAQANRGADLIRQIGCANCHGSSLDGGPEETPSLVSNEFVNEWANQTAYDLFVKVTSMPPNSRRRGAQDDVDIMTLLLAINGYPAAKTELGTDPEELKRIKISLP
jgi:hypothetical protein